MPLLKVPARFTGLTVDLRYAKILAEEFNEKMQIYMF